MQIEVSGESFGDRQQVIRKYCKEGMPAQLVREPDNEYDANAVAVYIDCDGTHRQIGYLNRESAAHYAPRLDQGKQFDATVYKIVGGGGRSLGVILDVYWLSKKELKARAERGEAGPQPVYNYAKIETAQRKQLDLSTLVKIGLVVAFLASVIIFALLIFM